MSQKTLNWTGRITQLFATNRAFALLAIVAMIATGVLGYLGTPKQYNPQITRPAFIVGVAYPGATTQEAYDLVASELIEKVQALPGVDEVQVQVEDGAYVAAMVMFDVGFSKDTAKVSLQTQLAQHSYLARGAIRTPTVREMDPDEVPILTVRLMADGRSLADLRKEAVALSHTLAGVSDVASVDVHGGYPPALVVEMSPEDLSRAQVSVGQVLGAIEGASREFPLVSLRDGDRRVLLDIANAGTSPEELSGIGITSTTRLGDVARVYRGTAEVDSYTRHISLAGTTTDAVYLSVAKRAEASAPVVSDTVRATLDQALEAEAYRGMTYEVVNDDGAMARGEIAGLMTNLLQSIMIVALVLVLFLSPRSALVVALSIPFTMLVVFALGYVSGQTVNRITLFALILSLGLLVDAAIVVVEAVHGILTRTNDGAERVRLVVQVVHNNGIGLFLSMLTSVVVFIPMLYISGMMGPYMGPIAFFVPAALVVSFLVAITVLPFLALELVHPGDRASRVERMTSAFMDRISERYRALLSWILSAQAHQRYVLGGALALFLLSLAIPLLQLVHFQMLPKANRDQYFIQVDLPAGTDVVKTRSVAERVASLALQDTHAVSVQLFVAEPPVLDFNGMFKGAHLRTAAHQATMRVNLVPKGERDDSSTDIAERARAAFLASDLVPEVESVRFVEDPPGPPVAATFVAKVSGTDRDARDVATARLEALLKGVPGVVDIDTSIEDGYGRLVLSVDQAAARSYGVHPNDVYTALALAGGPIEAGQWHDDTQGEYATIEVRMPRESRDAPSDLSALYVRSLSGALVPLEAVVSSEYTRDREAIIAEEGVPTRYVTAETEGRSIVYVMLDVLSLLRSGELEGFTVEEWNLFGMTLTDRTHSVRIDWGGEWEMTLENFRDLGLAMMAALLLVYGVLVAQYKNFRTPGLILVTVPLGLVGILAGFTLLDLIADIPLTATALIGFIALIGIVVNNAIILLERVEQAQGEGMGYVDAITDAAHSRLRPIMLTSLTTVLGSLTIAFDPVWSGLAWSIFFGLSLSTVLTLIVFPTLLVYTKK